MKLQEVTTYNLKSQTILNESWVMLTEAQRIHVGQWERRVWPLMEQLNVLLERELTPDQIQQIFTNAETIAVQGGNNKTALGKAGELTSKVTGKIKAEIEKLADQAKNSGPIKNMDQQFKKLRADIALRLDDNPSGQKVLDAVDQWKKWSDENPGKSAFVIGAMTSILAFASGGFFSGAAIGFFLRTANNVVKGDDLSTALGKGVKGAAIGAIAGGIGGVVADLLPNDLADTIIGANGDIDVDALDGMDAANLEDLSPQEAGDLLKTQEAFLKGLEDAIDDEAKSALQTELDQINDKIEQLGGENDVEAYADRGVDSGGAKPEADPDTASLVDDALRVTDGGKTVEIYGEKFSQADVLEKMKAWAEEEGYTDPDSWAGNRTFAVNNAVEELVNDSGITGSEKGLAIAELKDHFYNEQELSLDDAFNGADAAGSVADPDTGAEGGELTVSSAELAKMSPEEAKEAGLIDFADQDDLNDEIERLRAQEKAFANQEFEGPTVRYNGEDLTRAEILRLRDSGDIKRSIANKLLRKLKVQGAAESLEDQLHDEFALYEAGFADMIAKGKDKLKQTGKNIANKVTADKLNSMWKKSGSPTDTGSIINILSTAGLSDSEIGAVGREANVKLTKVTNKPGEKDQTGSGDIQQRMEKLAADIKKHNLQKEVIAMLNAQGDVQQPAKQPASKTQAGTQQGGYDTTVTQKQKSAPKPQVATASSPSSNPAYN